MINVSRDLGALGTIALTKRIRSDSHRSSLGVCAHACMSREVSIHCYFNSFVFLAFNKKQYVSSIYHLDYYQELILAARFSFVCSENQLRHCLRRTNPHSCAIYNTHRLHPRRAVVHLHHYGCKTYEREGVNAKLMTMSFPRINLGAKTR